MKTIASLLLLLVILATDLHAQSKSELQASVAGLTAQNDSLVKELTAATEENQRYARLIDTLSVMTGVHVDDLDTVRSVIELRASARAASTDSLAQVRTTAAQLQLTVDSLTSEMSRLRNDSTQLAQSLATVQSGTGQSAQDTLSKTDQLLKLDSLLQQGLITREEFLKMKGELMGK